MVMNKTAIKNFAIWARVNLIESAKQRAYEYEITDGGHNNPNAEIIAGRPLSRNEQNQRKQLIEQIRIKGFDQVMEEAAYTWFNRFIALRYMEVNGYLPTRVRVFTNEDGEFKPEILKEAMTVELDGLDREKVLDLLDKQDNEALYKILLIAQCNSLNTGLPYMFEKIANWTELLFPANLLKADSVIGQMVSSIPEDDWMDAVQIIGWMYQYYNSELKDETFALLKKNVKITKERIPTATQLFTPDWIVRYMVENSLGRIYIQRKLVNSGDWLVADETTKVAMEKQEAEEMGWKYYLPEAEQEPAVRDQLIVISNAYSGMKVEDIKVIDPCMGSGHILVYAFDVLMQIYTASGWSERDAAKSILENNLYGLDIDDRAGQLAYFAVMMKARKYNRRILNGEIRPNVMAIQDSSFMTGDLIGYVAASDKNISAALTEIKKVFTDAKEYGSILNVKELDFGAIYHRIEEIALSTPEDLFAMQNRDIAMGRLLQLIEQAEIMAQRYSVVVTNPPYMGSSGMGDKLGNYVKENYPNSKSDLFAAFIEKCKKMLDRLGYQAMITQHAWMFLGSYEKLRANIYGGLIVNMAHLGPRAFEEIAGEVVQTTSFVLCNNRIHNFKGVYKRLTDGTSQDEKEEMFLSSQHSFVTNQEQFSKVPGEPTAYWVSEHIFEIFRTAPKLGSAIDARIGMVSGDNDRFLRLWHEVSFEKIEFGAKAHHDPQLKKWYPLQKGGSTRYWYGNQDYLVNWENDGYEVKNDNYMGKRVRSHNYNGSQQFKEGISWNSISTTNFCCRYAPEGFTFDAAGPLCEVIKKENLFYVLAMLTSKVANYLFALINPTINFPSGYLESLPLLIEHKEQVSELAKECVSLSKDEWDSFEGSWNFKTHPLVIGVSGTCKLETQYSLWEKKCIERFNRLKDNEELLNEIFIEAYGLGDSLSSEVDESDVTLRVANLERDVKSLISYAVGCMFGRYSLDVEGLVYAGGSWDERNYKTYIPDRDAIIPITDDEYFEDDIVARFIKFIEAVYGKDVLEENLKFIANALGGKGTAREIIRNYFLNEFYADHCSAFSVTGSGKRPIYWLFDSGKKNGFKCLIYMHRYQPDTIARIRTDYIHELQSRYRTAIVDLEDRVAHAASGERVKLNKQLAKIKDQELELRKYEEKIHHLADQMIEIDLDDGVKVNYAKFGDVLAKIK